ncbi:AAA family ATPase [Paenibacillus maysiensis]|uniref:AAA family ATPase n=1 Tax=Paenibacillus maysiensis TaxID=1155954 RepID=UPI00046ECCDC|nr:AAA family ATPase [Paenibacillus maysiensis]
MKLVDVEVRNYRMLYDLTIKNSVRIDKQTTVIVGKNNSGKTSFTHIFELFLKSGKFEWSDFSSACHLEFKKIFNEYLSSKNQGKEKEFAEINCKDVPSIQMMLTIEYSDQDNWSNIRPLLTSLDASNQVQILFSYALEQADAFFEHVYKEHIKDPEKDIIEYISHLHHLYYKYTIRPYAEDVQTSTVSLQDIKKIIGTAFIAAQREVDDGNSKGNSKLSNVFQREYKNRSLKSTEINKEEREMDNLNKEVSKANSEIDEKLDAFFNEFISSYAAFGYPNIEDSTLILKSNMSITNVFQGIKLFYKDNDHLLPEKYNGLGYSNLIYIISEILSFKSSIQENGTDLNLIFIEEPEAHMHPQLQSILIQRVNAFLEANQIQAQVIITTHSSHIVSNSNFESIRYFLRNNRHVVVKDMMKFSVKDKDTIKDEEDTEYDIDTLQFLKRYITLVKCDMFFADKVIMIEGLCERLLMPMFLEKVDVIIKSSQLPLKILSEQYISVIEVSGAYMHKFKEFIEFLEVKTLIITDIDCCMRTEVKKEGITQYNQDGSIKTRLKKCEVQENKLADLVTTNPTLKEWLPGFVSIKELLDMEQNKKQQGNVAVSYQNNVLITENKVKCGRTFEEAFLIDNALFIFQNKDRLSSISKFIRHFTDGQAILDNSYSIYEHIDERDKKSNFAFDLMYLKDWNVPSYIKEGLLWLAM